MKCYKCGKGMDDGVELMIPIDPKGTTDRRWACIECIKDSAVLKIAKEVVDFARGCNVAKAALHVGDVVEVVKNINSQPEALIGMKGVIVEEITNNPDDPDFVDGANIFYKVQFDHAVHGLREWDFFETEELKKGRKNETTNNETGVH